MLEAAAVSHFSGRAGDVTDSDGNNQLVSYDYVVLYRNITNPIIIAPADYVT